MKRLLLVLFGCLVIIGPNTHLFAQIKFSVEERRILIMQDERRNADSLIGYLGSPDIKVAWRAAIAIANIGDTSVREDLIRKFRMESRDTIADAEAFAIGVLGPDANSLDALLKTLERRSSTSIAEAIGRAAPVASFPLAVNKVVDAMNAGKMSRLQEVKSFLEISLRKGAPQAMVRQVAELSQQDDPEIRWRTAFIFSRSVDSLSMSEELDKLRELLVDQGTPSSRMFAASALGKLHNLVADSILYRAYRSETEWRVRVNILNAFTRFPKFDTLIYSTYQAAILQAHRDDRNATSVGLTAMQDLEQFVLQGKLSAADSVTVRNWLVEFNGFNGEHDELAPIVVASATPAAVRLSTPNHYTAVQTFAQSADPLIRNLAVHAAGLVEDSAYFRDMLESMPQVPAFEQLARLEALDSMWQRAKHDPPFMERLKKGLATTIYRHMLIRISDIVNDPAVVTTALEQIKDPSIIGDTAAHSEAASYVTNYLSNYAMRRSRDQLLASVSAAHWLRLHSPEVLKDYRMIEDSALSWSDLELLDSIRAARNDAGERVAIRIPTQRRSAIDWAALERLPARWDINFERSTIQVRLFPYYAPLTCLNMVRLAQAQFFGGLKIHRVVPNFVIQSGDPTGTGWGGPGYSIRTEISPLEFDREGIAGIASSGRDTEGSQWFITECPTPHLTNHYTVWGEVENGIGTVLPVQQGDKVESVTTASK